MGSAAPSPVRTALCKQDVRMLDAARDAPALPFGYVLRSWVAAHYPKKKNPRTEARGSHPKILLNAGIPQNSPATPDHNHTQRQKPAHQCVAGWLGNNDTIHHAIPVRRDAQFINAETTVAITIGQEANRSQVDT